MEIKKNISVQDRVDFVNFVADSCEQNKVYVPALFDYVWRAAVVKWFAPQAWERLNSQEDICEFVYDADGVEIVEHPDIAIVTAGLYEACQEEIRNRREQYMMVYNSVLHPDPLERIADAFDQIAQGVQQAVDPETMVEIAKKAGLVGRDTEKEPIKLELAKKE